ncbi:proline-rich proteoglycan 2-like [Homarus americanus]|uniref:proline-rich proteoglycan 2-like n=1 Tax=Homarus americanus TaxID=6706 RepID=UPI001C457C52|nr:proline-rich proteoglycan 2-like [Homarus americanus]
MPPEAHPGVSTLPCAHRGPPNGGNVPMVSLRDSCVHRGPPRGPPRGSGVPKGPFWYPTVTVPPGTLLFDLPSALPPGAHTGVSALPGAPRGPPNGGGIPMGSPRDGCTHRDPPRGPPRGSGVPRGIFMVGGAPRGSS